MKKATLPLFIAMLSFSCGNDPAKDKNSSVDSPKKDSIKTNVVVVDETPNEYFQRIYDQLQKDDESHWAENFTTGVKRNLSDQRVVHGNFTAWKDYFTTLVRNECGGDPSKVQIFELPGGKMGIIKGKDTMKYRVVKLDGKYYHNEL